MIYYKISLYGENFQVKRLSPNIPLFRVVHRRGILEIYKNRSSGKWSVLFRSNPDDLTLASLIGPEIENSYPVAYGQKLSTGRSSSVIRIFS
ncbi:hypothetical protein HDE69_003689 [Pedobacter cryoconitis]|uniref:Uncharacterized protein n=1 Tax=Pedobacter cryoconitis TaxID=188932 RepID=A0A7W9DKU8_9SPHI|nr:hypothetical protein [Pedobacter cryoconitis]MBB5622611.1 hypothetical protein [Pedobacter cryoconitis]MBB5648763.1 hypothetical protein [Pedobacter cryoconitis]